jgi:hypothetical protein
MLYNLYIISDAILAETKAICYACGLSRSYLMATLDTELLEMRALLSQIGHEEPSSAEPKSKEPSAAEVLQIIDHVTDAVEACTANHALMTSNRRPQQGAPECEMLCPGFRYSALTYQDASAPITEQRLCRELLSITQSDLLPNFPVEHFPFPLCELALTLCQELKQLASTTVSAWQKEQCYSRQRAIADSQDPLLQEFLQRTIQAGFMTADGAWQPNVTRSQIALWVNLAASRLHISRQWKWARDRWGIDNLAQDQNKNLCGQYIPHKTAIERIFA